MTKAEAEAYASAVNLRMTDVPATRIVKESVTHPRVVSDLLRCTGVASAKLVAVESKAFAGSGGGLMSSSVNVMPTKAVAAAYVLALRTSRGRGCFTMSIRGEEEPTTETTLPVALPGSLPRTGFRVTTEVPALPTPLRTRVDAFFFVAGDAVIELLATSATRLPLAPAATERRLLTLLYRRAKAYKL